MKICTNCCRVNLDDAKQCIGCSGVEFDGLIIPDWDSETPYLEAEENGGKTMPRQQD